MPKSKVKMCVRPQTRGTEMRKEIDNLKSQLKQQEVRHSQQFLEHNNLLMQRMHDVTASNVQPNCFGNNQPIAGNHLPVGKRVICFSCGVPGHRKRECPNSETPVKVHVQNSYVPNQVAANRGPSSRSGVFYLWTKDSFC